MSQTKSRRPSKRQLGQFLTPQELAAQLVARLDLSQSTRVLEPSFGDGSFILPLVEAFLPLYDGTIERRLDLVLSQNVFGVEIDPSLHARCLARIRQRWGYVPRSHNLVCADFFRHTFMEPNPVDPHPLADLFGAPVLFDIIVGNSPFGGTIDAGIQDALDRKYGFRNGDKVKKETYSFFIVKSLDLLRHGGRLLFICSDTFITIPTMRGLRRLLVEEGETSVDSLEEFSRETSYPMVLLRFSRTGSSECVTINDRPITRSTMELTGNYSWGITDDLSKYFRGPTLGEYVICTSGMTIGKNEWFVKEIVDEQIIERYDYEFYEEPITVSGEVARARLNMLSERQIESVRQQERAGSTRRCVRVVESAVARLIGLPHSDYRLYNKSNSGIIYSKPTHAVYWKDEGDAVLTFKKSGNWYLRGVGGMPYFGRSGLTWQLIASRLNVRFLPEGYILDSGAPCAFLRERIDESELYFILGWACTNKCTELLKTVINHTQNIQSKDVERLPYPAGWMQPGRQQR